MSHQGVKGVAANETKVLWRWMTREELHLQCSKEVVPLEGRSWFRMVCREVEEGVGGEIDAPSQQK